MHSDARTKRHIVWAATTLASATTIVALSAPTALATVGPVEVLDCAGTDARPCPGASSIVVGHVYGFSSEADVIPLPLLPSSTVNFYDNGQCVGSAPAPTGAGAASFNFMYVYVDWVPTSAGTHKLTVTQGSKSASATVNVVAAPAGSTPAQPPKQAGCGGGGSLGYGSANLLPGS